MFSVFTPLPDGHALEVQRYQIASELESYGIDQDKLELFNLHCYVELINHSPGFWPKLDCLYTYGDVGFELPLPWPWVERVKTKIKELLTKEKELLTKIKELLTKEKELLTKEKELLTKTEELLAKTRLKREEHEKILRNGVAGTHFFIAHYMAAARLIGEVADEQSDQVKALSDIATHMFYAGKLEGALDSRYFRAIGRLTAKINRNNRKDVQEKPAALALIRKKLLDAPLKANGKPVSAACLAEEWQPEISQIIPTIKHSTLEKWINDVRRELKEAS